MVCDRFWGKIKYLILKQTKKYLLFCNDHVFNFKNLKSMILCIMSGCSKNCAGSCCLLLSCGNVPGKSYITKYLYENDTEQVFILKLTVI